MMMMMMQLTLSYNSLWGLVAAPPSPTTPMLPIAAALTAARAFAAAVGSKGFGTGGYMEPPAPMPSTPLATAAAVLASTAKGIKPWATAVLYALRRFTASGMLIPGFAAIMSLSVIGFTAVDSFPPLDDPALSGEASLRRLLRRSSLLLLDRRRRRGLGDLLLRSLLSSR